jgi:hypothetical protein
MNQKIVPQRIKIPDHPNHYVLLIDSSASAVSNSVKFQKYKEILTITLIQHLYHDGFEGSIPRFVPDEDILTLMHFGIVPKGYSEPYRYLKNYDLLTDFTQTIMVRQRGVSQNRLKETIFPEEYPRLTILAWAKPLALNKLLKDHFTGPCSRVFLIMVHDGIVNDGTLKDEITMAENWSNQEKLAEVKTALGFINENYMFSNGKGEPGTTWTDRITVQGQPYFIEVYEVVSKKQLEWESQLKKFNPFSGFTFSWERERGENPAGILNVNISGSFLDVMNKSGSTVSACLTFICRNDREQSQLRLSPLMKFPVTLSSSLPCESLNCRVVIDISVPQQDALLGQRTLHYHAEAEDAVKTPIPISCTVMYWVRTIAIILGIVFFSILLAWTLIWMYIYCHRKTHIKIKFPGLSFPIQIKRNADMQGETPVHPTKSMPAFTLLLPGWFKQHLLYSRVTISLDDSNQNRLYWQNGSKKTTVIKLPVKTKKINAWWNSVPPAPTDIIINFSQGNQKSKIQLYFPAGITEGEDK